jgi:hypothetical protein
MEWLPPRFRMLTRDQVRLLKHQNVVDNASFSLKHLGIAPSALQLVAPGYLSRYGKKAVHA